MKLKFKSVLCVPMSSRVLKENYKFSLKCRGFLRKSRTLDKQT